MPSTLKATEQTPRAKVFPAAIIERSSQMGDPVNAAFSSWSIPIGPSAGLLLSWIFYLRGWLRLQFQVPNRFPIWRLLAFTGGLATIFVAIASPLDAFAGLLLQVHMIQHLL